MKEELHKNHRKRLRERCARDGVDSLEEHELLELLLFEFQPRVNTNPTAHRLLEHFSSLDAVLHATVDELTAVRGIGRITAERMVNAANAERERRERLLTEKPISSFAAASLFLIGRMRAYDRPKSLLLMLDSKLHLMRAVPFERTSVLLMIDACLESAASSAIIGISPDALDDVLCDIDLFKRFKLRLCDIIAVDGLNAESVLPE